MNPFISHFSNARQIRILSVVCLKWSAFRRQNRSLHPASHLRFVQAKNKCSLAIGRDKEDFVFYKTKRLVSSTTSSLIPSRSPEISARLSRPSVIPQVILFMNLRGNLKFCFPVCFCFCFIQLSKSVVQFYFHCSHIRTRKIRQVLHFVDLRKPGDDIPPVAFKMCVSDLAPPLRCLFLPFPSVYISHPL